MIRLPILLRRSRVGVSSGISYASEPPQDGLIADWRFSEGSGSTVADEVGTYDIDLTAAAAPQNTAWESYGLSADNGGIETPSITGVRTIAYIYRTEQDSTGLLHAGPSGNIYGPYDTRMDQSTKGDVWIGQGWGLHPLMGREVLDDGTAGSSLGMNNGGWHLLIHELPAADDGVIAFGTRRTSTANRNTEYGIAWAGVWNTTLSAQDRADLYSFARGIRKDDGVYIDFRDVPTQADAFILAGQSTPAGRAQVSGLPAPDQTRIYTQTYAQICGFNNRDKTFSTMVIEETVDDSVAAVFGPEVPIANAREDTAGSRDLYIMKTAKGGTAITPTATTGDPSGWSTEEDETSTGFWSALMANLYYAIGDALDNGVGLDLKGMIWFQGESDAINTTRSAVYQTQTEALFEMLRKYLGKDDFSIAMGRIYDSVPDDATAYAAVRSAQAAIAAADSYVTLIDTDSMSRSDELHLDATGMQDFCDEVLALWWD